MLGMLENNGSKILFYGALGAGMYPLSQALAAEGFSVIGLDREAAADGGYPYPIYTSLPEETYSQIGLAVRSLAIPEDRPELLRLRSLGVGVIDRPHMLDIYSRRFSTSVAVSGSHGKSTVTAMLAHILRKAGIAFTAVGGAELFDGKSVHLGGGDIVLYEACEYRDAFLALRPTLAVITAVDRDHVDYFPDEQTYLDSFLRFAGRARSLVVNGDMPYAQRFRELDRGAVFFGEGEGAQYRYCFEGKGSLGQEFSLTYGDSRLRSALPVIGRYNIANAAAAIAAAHALGIDPAVSAEALATYRGIARRLERLEDLDGRPVYYDYGHHPTELRASITALIEEGEALTVVFRPHTYTRTAAFMTELAEALAMADRAIVLDIFPAREEPIPGVDGFALARLVGRGAVACSPDGAADYVRNHTDGTLLLLGAGDMSALIDGLYGKCDKTKK